MQETLTYIKVKGRSLKNNSEKKVKNQIKKKRVKNKKRQGKEKDNYKNKNSWVCACNRHLM